mmetsp:Transcript_95431/g.168607  ORF Transcript_95431/g.168607 Transcript_95431/m.168607 type:complete len:83 (+) Transcript_95431:1454-1702(+)
MDLRVPSISEQLPSLAVMVTEGIMKQRPTQLLKCMGTSLPQVGLQSRWVHLMHRVLHQRERMACRVFPPWAPSSGKRAYVET